MVQTRQNRREGPEAEEFGAAVKDAVQYHARVIIRRLLTPSPSVRSFLRVGLVDASSRLGLCTFSQFPFKPFRGGGKRSAFGDELR